MSDRMRTMPFDVLLEWILTEYRERRSIFGIPEALFYQPGGATSVASTLYGERLDTPIGPAAGPHTQLAQNIVSAWLCGGRFIELKTVQVMDELSIPRPCIDMADEGYNVEWSQELRLAESFDEYVKAWALVHVLRRLLGQEDIPFGTIFNMSVGYNLEGILSPTMQQFMSRLEDAEESVSEIRTALRHSYPAFADLDIPARIVSSVTLSTMHGCPPDEIERIARYLIDDRGLHTTVKLNPTLLGKEKVLDILHDRLGYTGIEIPDRVFEHDLQYERAVELIGSLQEAAASRGVVFAVKLSNTLALANHRGVLPGDEMYMSGRALFPVTVQLFRRLVDEFSGGLNVSYSAGADAWNVAELLASGARPVTVASDLLKPGGYGRLTQYVEQVKAAMRCAGVDTLDAFSSAAKEQLKRLAEDALSDRRYAKTYAAEHLPKVPTALDAFDCIAAPCTEACAVCQDVPEYCDLIARGEVDLALSIILDRNPLPGVTGHVCTNLCQRRCSRNTLDEPVSIRRLKRYAVEHGTSAVDHAPTTGKRVAVIGAGPSGLAAGYFLARSGVDVTLFEAKDRPGGVLALALTFRLPVDVVETDIRRITELGVHILTNHRISEPPQALLGQGFDAVYVACGFGGDSRLDLPGRDAAGVYGALDLLDRVAHGEAPPLGEHVVVIGGGNTAMDAARTARRLTGRPTTVVYRRSQSEMPAEREEINDLLAEGNILHELASPVSIEPEGEGVCLLVCRRNRLGDPDDSGRQRPVPIEGSEFRIPATAVVFAVGQHAATGFVGPSIERRANGSIIVDPPTGRAAVSVYAGGDAARGPEIIIAACADGRRAAESICRELGIPFAEPSTPYGGPATDMASLQAARARRAVPEAVSVLPVEARGAFDLVEATLDQEAARREAGRCLQCRTLCDRCVDVCPNRANVAYDIEPFRVSLPVFEVRGSRLVKCEAETFSIGQPRQIVHVDDLCNACGNCATFCIHEGEPYRDKPRLFLDEATFSAETRNAYLLDGTSLRIRTPQGESRVTVDDTGVTYEDAVVRIRMDASFAVLDTRLHTSASGRISLRSAVEAATLWRGITHSAPWLSTTRIDQGGSA